MTRFIHSRQYAISTYDKEDGGGKSPVQNPSTGDEAAGASITQTLKAD